MQKNASAKKANILTGENDETNHGNQFLQQKRNEGRSLKMLISHWFLRCDMHARLLHNLPKIKANTRAEKHA